MGYAFSVDDFKGKTEADGCVGDEVSFDDMFGQEERPDAGVQKITIQSLRDLLREQNGRCAISGIELTPEDCELDHIQAIANGGSHSMGNVQLLNSNINRMKGTMSNQEFIELAKKIAAHNESR